MKSTSLVLVIAISLTTALGAIASDKTAAKEEKAKKAAAEKAAKAEAKAAAQREKNAKRVLLTGSYIPQTIHKNERLTDGVNNLVILDQSIIQHTGAADL